MSSSTVSSEDFACLYIKEDRNMLKGIDISEHQGKYFKIADHSPEFVIIRGGFSETVDR